MEDNYSFPLLGEPFPLMNVSTTHGAMKLPDDYKGNWFIVFSHPADFTPVCTSEFVAFQNKHEEFHKLGCKLIGLSVDQVFSHIKWIEWIKKNLNIEIKFPVIAADENIAKKLGMLHRMKGNNTVRAVFIVDPRAIVRLVIYYPQEIGRNVNEILRSIKALQLSDKNNVAMPENWPENELIKDRVIVPPPLNERDAKNRLKEYEGFDWWFCHKKL